MCKVVSFTLQTRSRGSWGGTRSSSARSSRLWARYGQSQLHVLHVLQPSREVAFLLGATTANLRTRILDLGGFDSSRILTLRGGILMSIGDFPETLSQQIWIILVGRLSVPVSVKTEPFHASPSLAVQRRRLLSAP